MFGRVFHASCRRNVVGDTRRHSSLCCSLIYPIMYCDALPRVGLDSSDCLTTPQLLASPSQSPPVPARRYAADAARKLVTDRNEKTTPSARCRRKTRGLRACAHFKCASAVYNVAIMFDLHFCGCTAAVKCKYAS